MDYGIILQWRTSCGLKITWKRSTFSIRSENSILIIMDDDESLSLVNLPTDILLHIFSICGQDWWPVIAQVCYRFYTILGPNSFLWEQITKQLLFVNQSSPVFRSKYSIQPKILMNFSYSYSFLSVEFAVTCQPEIGSEHIIVGIEGCALPNL